MIENFNNKYFTKKNNATNYTLGHIVLSSTYIVLKLSFFKHFDI